MSKGLKKRTRALALKAVHASDGQATVRREDLVQNLLADAVGYEEREIEDILRRLRKRRLISIAPGRYSQVSIS